VDAPTWLLLVTTVLWLYCTGGSWMLQTVSYPGYHLVPTDGFVPFHVDSGKRLLPVFVAPAVLACLLGVVLAFWAPAASPLWARALVAVCGLTVLVTTVVLEVPKHNALDRDGKSAALIDGLVRDNLPRALAWTVGSATLVWLLVTALTQRA
jgi:hypothetical protein